MFSTAVLTYGKAVLNSQNLPEAYVGKSRGGADALWAPDREHGHAQAVLNPDFCL